MGPSEAEQLVAEAFPRWEKGEGSVFDVIAEGDTVLAHWKGDAMALAWFDAAPLNELINRVQPAQ